MKPWLPLLVGAVLIVQPGPRQVAITGGRVLDVASGRYRQATLVTEGDRIAVVQPPETALPDNVTRIDASGQTIVPGLVDLAVQATPSADLDVSYFYALSLAHGVTSLRVIDGTLPWAAAQRDRVREGEVLAPRLFVSGPGISTRSVVSSGAPAEFGTDRPFVFASDPASVAREVARQVAARVDWVRLRADASPDVVRAASSAARQGRVRISVSPGASTIGQLVQARVHAIDGLDGPSPPEASSDDAVPRQTPADPRTDAQALARARVTLIPLLRLDAERLGQDDARGREAELKLMPDRLRKSREERRPPPQGDPRGWRARVGLVKALAGQRGAVGAGSGSTRDGWPVPGLALHRELSALVAAGLSPADAIRAATATAAETLGVGGSLGQLRQGFRADLFIVRGDPLADVTALREIVQVVRGGEVLDRQALLASARRAAGPVR